ncbi:DUF1761 domain-containing protein [Salana multivorans]
MAIDWLGAVLGFSAGMVVAFLWYQKGYIAARWERLTGIGPEQSQPARTRNMIQLVIANALTALGLALVIGVTSAVTGHDSVWLALLVGLVAWLTLSATTLLQHNAFEQKPAMLTVINLGYQLALFLAISLVIGAL